MNLFEKRSFEIAERKKKANWAHFAETSRSAVQKHVNLVDLVNQELSNEYFLAKFGVDTEENEPYKV